MYENGESDSTVYPGLHYTAIDIHVCVHIPLSIKYFFLLL